MSTSTANDVGAGLGGWLRRARAAAGVTQEELAERSGVGVRTIGNLECGRTRKPYASSIRCLAAALGVPFPGQARAAASERASTAADPPAVVPRQLPAPVREFTGGRRAGCADRTAGPAPAPCRSAVRSRRSAGPPGSGKTALAVHWAHQVAGRFPDGQLYVNLRGYDPDQPMPAATRWPGSCARSACPARTSRRVPTSAPRPYRSLLAGRRMLVVLDNARGPSRSGRCCPAAPACVTVVTSRDALAGLVARDGARAAGPGPAAAARGGRPAAGADRRPGGRRPGGRGRRWPPSAPAAAGVAGSRRAGRGPARLSRWPTWPPSWPTCGTGWTCWTPAETRAPRCGRSFSWSYRHAERRRRPAVPPGRACTPAPTSTRTPPPRWPRTSPATAGQLLDQLARAHLIQPAGPGRYGMHDLLRGYARELAAGDGERASGRPR